MSEGIADRTQAEPTTPLISVIVPTQNEADNIAPLLRRLAAATADFASEIIFVDDSSDHTPNMIKLLAKKMTLPVRIIERPLNQQNGLSGALLAGMAAAHGEWLCAIDADLQHPPERIPDMLAHAQKTGSQLVVGSRKADLIGPLGLSLRRSATSQLLTLFAHLLFPRQLKNVSDALTGFFLVQRQAAELDRLNPNGFKLLLEILVRHPDLTVAERHFDFAERIEGYSKADFREGVRFLGHLLQLRLTANVQFNRFWLIGLTGLTLNSAVLIGLLTGLNVHYLLAATLASEAAIVWNFYWLDRWVFIEQQAGTQRERFGRFWASNQLFLLFARLPLFWLLIASGWFHYLLANLLSIGATSIARYILAKRWIWVNRSTQPPAQQFYYQIHKLLSLSSAVCLPALEAFAVTEPPEQLDVHIEVTNPTQAAHAIYYAEQGGWYSFSVLQGVAYSEVKVSPLLARSPHVLYEDVVEPLLRWLLVRQGWALVRGASAILADQGIIIAAPQQARATARLLAMMTEWDGAFLAGERVLMDKNGRLLSFPKPIRLHAATHQAIAQMPTYGLGQQLMVWLWQRENGRSWLNTSTRFPLPSATLNAYLHRYFPPPRYAATELLPAVRQAQTAQLAHCLLLEPHENRQLTAQQAAARLRDYEEKEAHFPPRALLNKQLSQWQSEDLVQQEQAIVQAALQTKGVVCMVGENGRFFPTLP